MTPCEEETLVVELRRSLALPLDDICEAHAAVASTRNCRAAASTACLKRPWPLRPLHPARKLTGRPPSRPMPRPGSSMSTSNTCPPLNRPAQLCLCRHRSRQPALSISKSSPIAGAETAGRLPRALSQTASRSRSIASSPTTASEFTDRFAVDKKDKTHDKPSGAQSLRPAPVPGHAIAHRLTRPFRPQTNGMVERFNRRLARAPRPRARKNRAAHPSPLLSTMPNAMPISTPFVADYNRTPPANPSIPTRPRRAPRQTRGTQHEGGGGTSAGAADAGPRPRQEDHLQPD